MIPKFVLHLLSGGLDSTVMLYDLKTQNCRIHALLFEYGQKHKKELAFAKLHCQRLGVNYSVIEIPQLRGSELTDGQGGMVVPCRNSIFLSLAVNLAMHIGAQEVTFAANADDAANFPDCRRSFVKAFNEMLRLSKVDVRIATPYIDQSKHWIALLACDLKMKRNETWSCYRGGAEPCGECEACKKRQAAFAEILK